MNMERVKVGTKYFAVLEQRNVYECRIPNMERVKKAKEQGHVLGCIIYDYEGDFYGRKCCSLYYNEGGFPKEDLKKAGYEIVSELKEIEVYEESKTVYSV